MLRTRLLTAIILIPLVVGAVALGGWPLFVFMGGAIILCGYEYFTMMIVAGYRCELALGVALVTLFLLDAFLHWHLSLLIVLAAVVLPPVWEFRRSQHDGFLLGWALTALGVVYIGLLGSYLFAIRDMNADGKPLLGVTLMATWATDTSAYLAGHAYGRRPFFQHISPKKTWEGAIGGVAGSAVVFGGLMWIYGLSFPIALLGGIGIGVAAAIGDLAESLIKRQVGAKDSGSLLAGHGGVLDRLDSMLFTVTFAYYFFLVIGLPNTNPYP